MLRFMGLQRVVHDWATEMNWTELKFSKIIITMVSKNDDNCSSYLALNLWHNVTDLKNHTHTHTHSHTHTHTHTRMCEMLFSQDKEGHSAIFDNLDWPWGLYKWNKPDRKANTAWMREFGSIINSMDINLSKLQEIVEDRGASYVTGHGITKSQI